MDAVSWSDWTGQHCVCVPPSGATLFKSIMQASPSVQVNKQQDDHWTHPQSILVKTLKELQKRASAAYNSSFHHFRQERLTPLLATLAGSSSHFQAVAAWHLFLPPSVGLMRILQTSRSHFGRASISMDSFCTIPSHRDTRHLRPPLNYKRALRNASGWAFMGVQIWAHFLINDWGARGGFMCVQSDEAGVLNIDDKNGGEV